MSKTDRELLELAAKAAGLNVKAHRVDQDDKFVGLIVGAKNTRERIDWNPLADDGDALRLAVRLQMVAGADCTSVHEMVFAYVVHSNDARCYELSQADPYVATRRCIVRAAASIGEKK